MRRARLPILAGAFLGALPQSARLPEGLPGGGSDRGTTPLGKAAAVAIRLAAGAEAALVPGSTMRGDLPGGPLDLDSIRGAIRDEPFVAGEVSGATLLDAVARAVSRRTEGGSFHVAGLVFDEEAFDAEGVLVGRELLDRKRPYRTAAPRSLAGSLGLDDEEASGSIARALLAYLEPASAGAESARRFARPGRPFPVERSEEAAGPRLSVERATFPSPLPSGVAANDRVTLRLFRPAEGGEAAVLVLPIWKGGTPLLEEGLARALAARGFVAAVMPLAYQFERAPPGVRSGAWTVSADLERTARALEQSLADARRAADFFEEEGFGGLGVVGVSLGGHVASVLHALDDRFAAGAFVLAGGGLADAVWAASRETRKLRDALEARGLSREAFAEAVRPFDPLTHARPGRGQGILLVGGTRDAVVPPRSVERLWEAYAEPEILWVDADHYSGVLHLPEVLEKIARHFERTLRREATSR